MSIGRLISIIIVFIIAGILALLSFRSFQEKGFLFNNAYIYANKEERKAINKKPWYRQSAIAFCLLSIASIMAGLDMIFDKQVFRILEFSIIIGAVLYAIISSVVIMKRENKQ